MYGEIQPEIMIPTAPTALYGQSCKVGNSSRDNPNIYEVPSQNHPLQGLVKAPLGHHPTIGDIVSNRYLFGDVKPSPNYRDIGHPTPALPLLVVPDRARPGPQGPQGTTS